ncbi:MAG: hypothetical protein AB8G11_19565 [Saprospiraceae bacterium]
MKYFVIAIACCISTTFSILLSSNESPIDDNCKIVKKIKNPIYNKNDIWGKWNYKYSILEDTCFDMRDFGSPYLPTSISFNPCIDSLEFTKKEDLTLLSRRKENFFENISSTVSYDNMSYVSHPTARYFHNKKLFVVNWKKRGVYASIKLEYMFSYLNDTMIIEDRALYMPEYIEERSIHIYVRED